MSVEPYRIEEESLLLTEFNHRLFNTFQIIGGQVATCAQAPAPDVLRQSLRDLAERIRSLAIMHRLLAKGVDNGLEARCQELCQLLARSFGREDVVFCIRMEPLPLDGLQEQRIALLVVELVTNVFKHSLVDAGGGTVWVDLRAGPSGAELSVSDSQQPTVICKTLSTIVRALTLGLSGTATILDQDGYTVQVRFPIISSTNPVGEPAPGRLRASFARGSARVARGYDRASAAL